MEYKERALIRKENKHLGQRAGITETSTDRNNSAKRRKQTSTQNREKNVMSVVKRIRCGAEERVTRREGDRRSCLDPCKFLTTKGCLSHFCSKTLCPQHKRKPKVHMGR
jgi:hypothetical protein